MVARFFLILIFSTALYASSYVVVVNKKSSIESLSSKEIRDIYLMKRYHIGSQKVVPVNTASSISLRLFFEENVLEMSRDKLNAFWVKQHFQGIKPPLTQSSLEAMKLFIKNVDEAIGYLPKEMVDSDMRTIHEF
jgi:ABC-type phosphate transport system substrate-binding protein